MRRVGLVALVVVSVFLAGARTTFANVFPPLATPVQALCTTVTPYYTLAPCPVSSATPTRGLIFPDKSLSLGGGVPGPDNSVAFPITITSRLACFTLNEPIYTYVMGVPRGAGVIYQVSPTPIVQSLGSSQQVNVDPATGVANLQLEVYTPALLGAGITVKAVWPQEGVEQLAVAIAPAPTAAPTSTPTPGSAAGTPSAPPPSPPAAPAAQPTYTPAPPTATPTHTPVPTSTPTPPTPTGTPIGQKATPTSSAPAGTPTPSPTPDTRPFFASSCLTSSVVSGAGGGTTIYVLTKPGAVCTAKVGYLPNGGPLPADFNGSPQVALADGLAIFPLTVNALSFQTMGVAVVTCTLNGQTATTSQPFSINPPVPTDTPVAVTPTS